MPLRSANLPLGRISQPRLLSSGPTHKAPLPSPLSRSVGYPGPPPVNFPSTIGFLLRSNSLFSEKLEFSIEELVVKQAPG